MEIESGELPRQCVRCQVGQGRGCTCWTPWSTGEWLLFAAAVCITVAVGIALGTALGLVLAELQRVAGW